MRLFVDSEYDIVIIGYGFAALYIARALLHSISSATLRIAILKPVVQKHIPANLGNKARDKTACDWQSLHRDTKLSSNTEPSSEQNQYSDIDPFYHTDSVYEYDFSAYGLKPNKLLAIAHGTAKILYDAGCISEKDIHSRTCPISQIRVVDCGSVTKVDFFPESIGIDSFGFMITERDLHSAMESNFHQANKNIEVIEIGSLEAISFTTSEPEYFNTMVDLELPNLSPPIAHLKYSLPEDHSKTQIISAKLCIGADGRNSKTRKVTGIGVKIHSYGQIGIVCDILHEFEHCGIALEQFRANGPLAILPHMNKYRSSLVWVEPITAENAVRSLSNADLLALIDEFLAGSLGKILKVSNIEVYPLERLRAEKAFFGNVVLVGDAAEAFHPIAGQGANLALRGAKRLFELADQYWKSGLSLASVQLMKSYTLSIRQDAMLMSAFTTFINFLFRMILTH